MGRTSKKLTGAGGITDRLSFAALVRALPRKAIEEEIVRKQRKEQRVRMLPSYMVVYYVVAMSFFTQIGVVEVLRWVMEGIRNFYGLAAIPIASKGAITTARARVGAQVVKALYERLVEPQAVSGTKGAWHEGMRLVAIDGSTLDLQDTQENAESFGYAEGGRGESAFPKLRFVSLLEVGTRVLFGAQMDAYAISEQALARKVITALRPDMLCLADRLFYSFDFWRQAAETGAQLLWRVKNNTLLPVERRLADGSWLTTLYPDQKSRRHKSGGAAVRAIRYRLKNDDGSDAGGGEDYLLLTTLLDSERHPAVTLAGLYPQRWEIETSYDEFKTHLRGGRVVLRSKTPELVRQEFYGFMLAHFCTRQLMHEAALANDLEPLRLSFKHAVEVIRRNLSAAEEAAFPPSPAEDGA